MNDILADALHYASKGLPVFPLHGVSGGRCTCGRVCGSPGKHPKTRHGLSDAATDERTVTEIFEGETYESTNLGVCTGREANLVVIDVDVAKGASLSDLFLIVPESVMHSTSHVRTGGGFHFLFQYPTGTEIRNSTSKILPNVDVRGNGGYIVAPSSMHLSGKRYEYLNDVDELKPFPDAFIAKLLVRKSSARATPTGDVINNGSRNATMASIAGSMHRRGMAFKAILAGLREENEEKCKPPLDEQELVRIVKSIQKYDSQNNRDPQVFAGMFRTQPANQWIKESSEQPMPKKLCGDLWLEGELNLTFSDTGLGKTIYAVQTANDITRGEHLGPLPSEIEPQKILYFDFELSSKQFEGRYSYPGDTHYLDPYHFSDTFLRAEVDPDRFDPDVASSYEQYVLLQIEAEFLKTGAKIGFIDNITYLGKGTETARDALPLMKGLNRLKKKLELSLMVLAHTPKRDQSRPLSINDLQGSKMLSNFADTIVGIGASAKDTRIRYIKQLKVRSGEVIYDTENVLTCQVVKPDNFLKYDFLGHGCEREHLKGITEATRGEVVAKAKTLSAQGLTQRKIANELGISAAAVNKYLGL